MEDKLINSEDVLRQNSAKTLNSSKTENCRFSEDLSSWMSCMPEELRRLPIIHLAIPGSHDSGTWPINEHSDWAPDLDSILKKLKWLGIIVKWVTSRWSKAQDFNVLQQLEAGVRYFDLRIATRVSKDNVRDFYIVHGLYGPPLKEVLAQIQQFLTAHPKEVVIIDCQHFYSVTTNDHDTLATIFYDSLKDKIVQTTSSYMNNLTMNYMNDNQYQVIMVYRNSQALKYNFFPSSAYPTPWPDTTNPDILCEILTENLRTRNNNVGYVSQFILTPVAKTILTNLFTGNLKKFSGLQLLSKKLHWVKEQTPGARGVNVIIADFVDIQDQNFCRTVIDLNQKLLAEGETELETPRGLPPVTN